MSRYAAFLLAVAILLGSGVAYHSMARDSDQLDAALLRIARVPMVVGDWKAIETPKDEGDDRTFEQAGAKAYWMRSYVNERTDASVLVILMCGRAGKMAVHTPEVCYHGAGFELKDQPAVFDVKHDDTSDAGSRFWTGAFSKRGPTTGLRLFWAWNARGAWDASPNPRWQFRGEPFLYKLYVSRDVSNRRPMEANADPAADLLRVLLPEMNLCLFPKE